MFCFITFRVRYFEYNIIISLRESQELQRSYSTPTHTRRLGDDLFEVFKIFKGFDYLDPSTFFDVIVKHIQEVTLQN